MLRLLSLSAMATNGISPEEKLQKITEAIFSLVSMQATFVAKVDERIRALDEQQCADCPAKKHAAEAEQKKHDEELIAKYKLENHIIDEAPASRPSSLLDKFIEFVLNKPYAWVFLTVAVFSPFAKDIVQSILSVWAK